MIWTTAWPVGRWSPASSTPVILISTAIVSREEQVQELVDHGKVQAVIRLNKGFEENLKAGRKGIIQLIVDGTDSNTAAIVLNYSGKIVSRYSQDILIQRLAALRGPGQTAESGGSGDPGLVQ